MSIEALYILSGICFFIYAIVQRNNPERYIMFPVSIGVLFCLFGLTCYYGYQYTGTIKGFIALIVMFLIPFYKRKKCRET